VDNPLILAVDCNARNLELLAEFLHREGYEVYRANSIEQFVHAVENLAVNLALVDISGFDRNIWESCIQLRHKNIPFLVLSSKQTQLLQQESVVHGARGVLIKPLVIKNLLVMIEGLL
jgi:DNA-binding response OmpR family regulator